MSYLKIGVHVGGGLDSLWREYKINNLEELHIKTPNTQVNNNLEEFSLIIEKRRKGPDEKLLIQEEYETFPDIIPPNTHLKVEYTQVSIDRDPIVSVNVKNNESTGFNLIVKIGRDFVAYIPICKHPGGFLYNPRSFSTLDLIICDENKRSPWSTSSDSYSLTTIYYKN